MCNRIPSNSPLIKFDLNHVYLTSQPQIYVPGIGTLGRTGVCLECGSAIYRKEGLGKPGAWHFPQTLEGPKYHAVEGGLMEIQ
jgi:hypothetical protein